MPMPRYSQELDKLITFQTASGAMDLRGGRTTLVTYKSHFAKITESGGMIDTVTQNTRQAHVMFEIWIRYDSGVTGFMQILYGTRVLIQTATPQKVIDGLNRQWLMIQAEEITEGD